jgi:hypothetical protein
MESQMFNHLVLAAQQCGQLQKVELFLNYRNLEQSSCEVKWGITLPTHLKATSNSKAPTGITTILPTEGNIVLGSWTLDVLPVRDAQADEIEAAATLTVGGTDFKSDATRATLSSLLKTI